MKKLNTKEEEKDFTDLFFNYGVAAEKRIKSAMTSITSKTILWHKMESKSRDVIEFAPNIRLQIRLANLTFTKFHSENSSTITTHDLDYSVTNSLEPQLLKAKDKSSQAVLNA